MCQCVTGMRPERHTINSTMYNCYISHSADDLGNCSCGSSGYTKPPDILESEPIKSSDNCPTKSARCACNVNSGIRIFSSIRSTGVQSSSTRPTGIMSSSTRSTGIKSSSTRSTGIQSSSTRSTGIQPSSTRSTTVTKKDQNVFPIFKIQLFRFLDLSFIAAILLVMLLRISLVEGVPLNKIRHNHFRPENLPSCSQRFKRDIDSMSLKEAETSGLCPSRACLDIDERRRPVYITRVFCLPTSNSSCPDISGDFHCTQLYSQMEVWQEENKPRDGSVFSELWTSENKTRAIVPTKIRVEHGCICASINSKPAVNPIDMVF